MMLALLRFLLCSGFLLGALLPGVSVADGMSGVGDLTITTLDVSAQKILAANGVVGATQVDMSLIDDCAKKKKDAGDDAKKAMATSLTPSDTAKKLNDSVNACFANIQMISMAFNLPTSFSFTELFEQILKQLIEKLVDEVIMKICAAATGAWNSAVGNAINTINSGINQSGINTFGTFVSVGSPPPAPMAPASVAPAPVSPPSPIPGL
ncbi:hypothetical protein [Undibacterium sp. TS12]|uniref:hypothetical protein n=1 Tax=Undibacterium sp. TS12 TaxID=2908202 RepID=UPI001F4C9AC8|nr:hypothetical protein [Undibacterium sp. TS12]MCH8621307.1 hypothetical protein [Undibacterium sp. TS12]